MRRLLFLSLATLACARAKQTPPTPNAGDSLYAAGDFAAARTAYRKQLAGTAPGSPDRAHVLTSIALSAYHLGDYAEARRTGDSALTLMGPSASMSEAFRVHNALGLVAWQQGRLPVADTFFHNALRFATAAHDTANLAKASANLALVFTDYGDFAGARTALMRAREAAHAIGNKRVEGNTYTNLAMLSLRTGAIVDGEAEAGHALEIYHAVHYETGAQNAWGQLATIEAAKGDAQAAFAAVDSALVIVRRERLRQEEASDLAILGDLYAEAGDLRAAALYYDRAERAFTSSGIDLEAANVLRARADVDAAHGDTASARQHVRAALAAHHKLGARPEELNDRLAIADLAPAADPTIAFQLDTAQTIAKSLGSQAAEARTVLARARYEERCGRPREVLQILSRDIQNPRVLEQETLWEVAALRLRAWARLGNLDSAERSGRESIALVERSRRAYGSAELRTSYTARMAQVYTDLVLVLLRRGNLAGAFQVADAARGRALVEHLASARSQLAANSAPALFVDAELLGNRIDSLVSRLDAANRERPMQRGSGDEDVSRDLDDQLARIRDEYEAALNRAKADDNAGLLGLTPLDVTRVQASLARNEALIDYLITRDTLLIFVVRHDGIRVARAAVASSRLNAQARVVRELLGTRSPTTNVAPATQGLYDVLIAPAQAIGGLRDVSRLVIVPHEALVYVPFAALEDRETGKALVEEYVLSYLPSAAAMPVLRGRGDIAQQGSKSAAPARAVALAPFTKDLPATAVEARRFATRVPGALARFDGDATERQLRASLASGGVVHVASHADLNVRNPMFSAIRLARGDGAREDDGRLEVYEIFNIAVRSPLVFLSGCETGAGSAWSTDFERGEDYATLSRALLYAGARNVVATLWRIDDEGAAEFADRFYANRHDADEAQALALAQRAMLRDVRYRSPYYWAGYQLSGAGR